MTQEERDEKNKKHRQAYQLRKAKTTLVGQEVTPWSSYNQAIIYIDIYICVV